MQVRRSLLLGGAFAALLAVGSAAAVAVWWYSVDAQRRIMALVENDRVASRALASVRANIYLTGILTRELLLEPDSARAQEYRHRFQSLRAKIAADLQLLDTDNRDQPRSVALKQLRVSVDGYLDLAALVLNWTQEDRDRQEITYFRERVRRREEVTELAAQIERLMSQNFAREKERLEAANANFRRDLEWIAYLCLIFGVGIASATLVRMNALERRSERSESELRRLSIQARSMQEQERKFLSRELHDQIGQMLTGLRLELSNLARLPHYSEPELSLRIAHAKGIVEQTLSMVRNIAMLLRPSMLDDLGLGPALAWLAKDISRSGGIEIETNVDPVLDSLPDSYRTCLYRVTQEALTNVSRHAHALKASVWLRAQGGSVIGGIQDDGCGFDVDAVHQEGLGLIGIEERVRELGGQVRIVSGRGLGTQLEIRMPIPQQTEIKNDSNPDRRRSRDRSSRVETSA